MLEIKPGFSARAARALKCQIVSQALKKQKFLSVKGSNLANSAVDAGALEIFQRLECLTESLLEEIFRDFSQAPHPRPQVEPQ